VVREDATLALDRSGVNFTKNLVTMRVEGRFGLAIKRPASFAVIDLAARASTSGVNVTRCGLKPFPLRNGTMEGQP
jgi:hypothetical protein